MRFPLDDIEDNDKDDQLKFIDLIERMNYKNNNFDDYEFLMKRDISQLHKNNKQDNINDIVNDIDTLLVCNQHEHVDILNSY